MDVVEAGEAGEGRDPCFWVTPLKIESQIKPWKTNALLLHNSCVPTLAVFNNSRNSTRNSALLDKPARRVYRSVKVTKQQYHSICQICLVCNSGAILKFAKFMCNSNFVFNDIRLEKRRDLEIRVRDHSRSLKVVPFYRFDVVSYQCSIKTLYVKRTLFEIFDFKNAVTLKTGLGVRQGHWKCHHVIECI